MANDCDPCLLRYRLAAYPLFDGVWKGSRGECRGQHSRQRGVRRRATRATKLMDPAIATKPHDEAVGAGATHSERMAAWLQRPVPSHAGSKQFPGSVSVQGVPALIKLGWHSPPALQVSGWLHSVAVGSPHGVPPACGVSVWGQELPLASHSAAMQSPAMVSLHTVPAG